MKQVAYDQPTAAPTPKMASVAVGGATVTVVIFVAKTFFKVDIPADVAAAAVLIVTFLSGYFTKDRKPAAAVPLITKGVN